MEDQDELVQVGLGTTILQTSMSQNSSFQGDRSLEEYPEITTGAKETNNAQGPPPPTSPPGGRGASLGIHTPSSQIGLTKATGYEPVYGNDETNDRMVGTRTRQNEH